MKKLNDYRVFQTEKFLKGKKLGYLKGKELKDKTGVSITVIILEDADGENQGEQFAVKVKNADENFLKSFNFLEPIAIFDVEKATVYGDFQNQLSLIGKVRKYATNNGN